MQYLMKAAFIGLIGAAAVLCASTAMAQTARDIRGPASVVPPAGEPPAKIVIDRPLADSLAHGRVVIQYRAENLRIVPGLASDPDGYFCAVEEGRIRGMVSALVRGRVWYLSMFFVLPGDQERGLGRALLERALAYGEARAVEVRCVWASLDPRAQARYVMAGMAPRWPIYRLDGDVAAVLRLKARVGLDPRARELPCDPGAAEKLTAEVFGHGRADDLAHWRGDGGAAVAIERGSELAAFAYRRGERIGPAAGRNETALLQAVAAAAAAGARSGGIVTLRVPGACASLLEALVGCGFRIGDLAVFMASALFGRPELYLPSGPILY
jgi:GNAT superfamily N-acetyltransferase